MVELYVAGVYQLVALFLESILFGIFAVLYGISIWILVYRQRHSYFSKLNKMLLGTGTVMFILAVVVCSSTPCLSHYDGTAVLSVQYST